MAPITEGFSVSGSQGRGVANTDFILYVSAQHVNRCSIGSTVAYAAYCQLESAVDRLAECGISEH